MADDSEQQKLDSLADRIKKAQETADINAGKRDDRPAKSWSRPIKMIRIGSDFVALVVLSAIVGWFLDNQAGTEPLLMLVFLVAGFVGGFWMLVRVLGKKEDPAKPVVEERKE